MKFLYKTTRIVAVLLSIVTVLLTVKIFLIYRNVPEKERPIPFSIDSKIYTNSEVAQNSDVLIIGDKLAISFNDQIESLVSSLSKNLKKPIAIYNYSSENENIYRTLIKLKGLKKLPNIVIYMGGSSEFTEALFPKNIEKTWINFNRYNNEFLSSLVMVFPVLSRFIFEKDYNRRLTSEAQQFKTYGDMWFQRVSEMTYYYYKDTLRELVDYIQEQKSSVILVTSPINLEEPPKNACDNASSDDLAIELNDIELMISESRFKEALSKLEQLNNRIVGNAKVKFLLGKIELQRRNISKAKEFLIMARALDCTPPRESIVINAIIKSMAEEKNVDSIDFENMINQQIGRDTLFISSNSPQFIYWEKLEKNLSQKIKGILDL